MPINFIHIFNNLTNKYIWTRIKSNKILICVSNIMDKINE